MSAPEFPVTGGCQCGAVRYRLTASPQSVYNCHCKDCQRFSGAAWSMSMIVKDADFELVSGKLDRFEKTADSGNVINMHFCSNCHGWVWNSPSAPGIKVVRAGTLDDLDWAAPVGNIWTDSKAAWVNIDQSQVNFAGGPTDRTPLFEAWTRSQQD